MAPRVPNDPPQGGEAPELEADDALQLQDDAPPEGDEPEGDEPEGDEPEGDEPEGDEPEGDEPEGDEPSARGNRAVGALRADRRRLAEENAALTRQLDEVRRGASQQQPQPVETPQQRAERFALMSPEERIRTEVQESLARHEHQNNVLMGQLLDQSDRVAFDAEVARNPLFKKLAPEVERRLADVRSKGQNLPRKTVLTYLLGEKLLAQQGQKRPGAAQRRDQQRARPARTGGDVQPDRRGRRDGNDVAALERRLENVQI